MLFHGPLLYMQKLLLKKMLKKNKKEATGLPWYSAVPLCKYTLHTLQQNVRKMFAGAGTKQITASDQLVLLSCTRKVFLKS